MKITKRPKRTTVRYKKVVEEYAIYTCPSCKVEFHGGGVNRSITRFKCHSCGQELIVDKVISC